MHAEQVGKPDATITRTCPDVAFWKFWQDFNPKLTVGIRKKFAIKEQDVEQKTTPSSGEQHRP